MNKKLRIAQLIPSFKPIGNGGAEVHVHNISDKFVNLGHEVVIITVKKRIPFLKRFNYKIEFISKITELLLLYFPYFGKIVLHIKLKVLQRKYNFDLWQVTLGAVFSLYSVDFFNANKIPCLLRCAGEDINRMPEIGYGYRLNKKFNNLALINYPKFDKLIALTESVKKEYLDMNINEDKISIIPNGVDYSRFINLPMNNNLISKVHNEVIILTVGRHHPIKNYDIIPQIANNLVENKVKFKWYIIGKNFETFINKHNNLRDVNIFTLQIDSDEEEFILPSTKLIQYYKAADLFVFPTLLETFGMVAVEAMAAGLPIITTDAPGIKDVIDNYITGIKVPVNDCEKMTNAIIEVISNDALKRKLIYNSIKKVQKYYDWNIIIESYLFLYTNLLCEKSNER